MAGGDYLDRLAGATPPPAPEPPPRRQPPVQADGVPAARPGALAFWESPLVRACINGRITGDERVAPEKAFVEFVRSRPPLGAGISLRAGDAALEASLLQGGACERIVGIDTDARRVEIANRRVPEGLRDRLVFELASLEDLAASGDQVGLAVTRSAMHRVTDLERHCELLASVLRPGGLLYVDEFIGPQRFQWTDKQIDIVNRLLATLPEEFKVDLTADPPRPKNEIGRPNLDRFIHDHPEEAVRSGDIVRLLDQHFRRVKFVPYGGAIFHQLFSRIMGNFAENPAVVRTLMELDAVLTDEGVVSSDYLWAIYEV